MSGTELPEGEAGTGRSGASPEPASSPPPSGLSLSRYEIREPLGEGATAVVYRAFDRELKRHVALKISRDAVGRTPTAKERFRREAQTAAGLSHPNLITVFDAGESSGRLYLVMELVEGRPFGEILKERGGMRRHLELLEKAARGVAVAHAQGVVHRDLKPGNILVTRSGEPKVGDFGLAHLADTTLELTRTGTPLGTPVYMSPEQVEGRIHDLTPRSDVYSLGAILYEILAGEPPHIGESLPEIYRKILNEDPAPPRKMRPQIPPDLQTVALKALEKDPGRRYASAGEFADDLGRYLAGEPVAARPPSLVYGAYKRLRKRAWAIALGATVIAAGVASAWIWWRGAERSRRLLEESRLDQAKYEKERDLAIRAMRDVSRTALSAALNLRRKGATVPELRPFVQMMKDAYLRATEQAPQSAEVEYLMGRMRRIVVDPDLALDHENRALKIDPLFGPALYERIVLKSRINSYYSWTAISGARSNGGGGSPSDLLARALALEPRFAKIRREILDDLASLEAVLAKGVSWPSLLAITEAHVLSAHGFLAYWTADLAKARELLGQAVHQDPLLDEAWELLGDLLLESVPEEGDVAGRERRWKEALDCFDQAIRNDLGYPRFWNMRGQLHLRWAEHCLKTGGDPLPSFAEAEKNIVEGLRLLPNQYTSWREWAVARFGKGQYLRDRGENPLPDFDQAESCLDEALRLSPNASEVLALRGSARWEKGKVKEKANDRAGAEEFYKGAVADFEKAISLNPALRGEIDSSIKHAQGRLRSLRP